MVYSGMRTHSDSPLSVPAGRIVIRGGGEMGTGVAWRLRRCGCNVIITETEDPMAVRRWVAFSEAVYDSAMTVEGITARLTQSDQIDTLCAAGEIPLLIVPSPTDLESLQPDIIIDSILAKRNTGLTRDMARLTIGLGPGFTAGDDVHCVIETNRGPNLGRCIWTGSAEPNTGVPGLLGGETARRVLRAPIDGKLRTVRAIGNHIKAGDQIAAIDGQPVLSELDGIVRGLLRVGAMVKIGTKIGDIDPRGEFDVCRKISDKAHAIADGVLQAIQ